ncbi:MAG TPA: hypothetical protein VEQ87_24495 [Burkholderiales bacterium]|nr:hypothetical protein [Burkholderiales bacterium]
MALACGAASAAPTPQFISLLKNSPAELFDDTDLRLFLDAARKALDEGDMTVVKRYRFRGHDCTHLRVRNEAQGRKSDKRHNLCSINGQWRLVREPNTGETR